MSAHLRLCGVSDIGRPPPSSVWARILQVSAFGERAYAGWVALRIFYGLRHWHRPDDFYTYVVKRIGWRGLLN
jgi:hypothetical protein